MILQHILTKEKITVTNYLYRRVFIGAPHEWRDVTPPRTQKQIEASERFVKLGKLHRTKANLLEVIRVCGTHHGIFTDAVHGINQYIEDLK